MSVLTSDAVYGAGKTPASTAGSVQIAGAKPVGSETCATCHEDVGKSFAHAYHAQQGVQCEQCHGNGSLHVEGGGDVAKIISFKQRTAKEANSVCLSCHSQGESTRHWLTGVHAANGVRCIDCHQVHATAAASSLARIAFDTAPSRARDVELVSPETNRLVESRAETNDACVRCHQTENAQLSMPYHHPLREGKMSCADCHDPHGGRAGRNLRTANTNELCLGCHAQYRGPFAYQHPPVTENCLTCHTPHGSPNTNLLTVSEPALCLQCHSGHHNGASLPLADRCSNCHASIHGTDIATPSGGSRFMDKGQFGVPSEPAQAALIAQLRSVHGDAPSPHARTAVAAAPAAALGMHGWAGAGAAAAAAETAPAVSASAAVAWSPAAYRILDVSGFAGRVGEYDSLEQSAGSSVATAFVDTQKRLTLVSRGTAITGNDYSLRSQLTAGRWLRAGLDLRSLVQQQDHYLSYLAQLSPTDFGLPGAVTDAIPANANFAITRRLGSGYARFKMPHIPVHLFVEGEMQARSGMSQLTYLDENSSPAVYVGGVNTTCGAQCHQASVYQPVNYTKRNIAGGADTEIGKILRLTYKHSFSSFHDRLVFPTVTYTGPFTPENEGLSTVNPPPSGPAPQDVPVGSFYFDPPSPSQFSADAIDLNLTPSEQFVVNSHTAYTRLSNTFTHNPQNWFDTDDTASWTPQERVRLTADYHQQNTINGFVPYYTLYGNDSIHRHWEGIQAEFELPAAFSIETRYRRTGITRSNAALWPQVYSMDNTDLQTVIPSTTSDTAGLALHYHAGGLWNARAGYEWTGTSHPGFLIVPRSDNRIFAGLWVTPRAGLTFSNDFSAAVQNAFPSPALPNTAGQGGGFGTDVAGLPANYQRRDRIYTEAASLWAHPTPQWNLGAGYTYEQTSLKTYMAFQNDSSVAYVVDEPLVPYKQLSQVGWGEAAYTPKSAGFEMRLTHNGSSSSYRPDLNPNDAAALGNASLIQEGNFDPVMFQSALDNLALSSGQISAVRVPQWIGQSKAYNMFPHRIEGGIVFYYGSYANGWNPSQDGVLRVFDVYVGRKW